MDGNHRRRIHRKAWASALGIIVVIAGLGVPVPALAVDNTIRIMPSTTTGIAVGATFTVTVVQNAGVLTSGVQATVGFDPTKLQVETVAPGAPYSGDDTYILGAGPSQIASANSTGSLKTVAVGVLPPHASVPVGDQDVLVIGFRAIASGVSALDLPIGPSDASLLDGQPGTYGDPLPVVSTGGSVTIVGAPPVAAITALPTWVASQSVAVNWNVVSGGPATSFDVRYRRAAWNGAFGTYVAWQSATAATGLTFTGAPGSTYCLSARATAAGGLSPWTAETCTAIPLDDRSLTRTGRWALGTGSAFFRSTNVKSSTLSAKLTRTNVVAKRIAIVATTCPTCGSVKVYWGTTLLKTIRLYSATTVNKKLITVTTFTAVKKGTLSIKVSTSGKKVLIDGVAIRRN